MRKMHHYKDSQNQDQNHNYQHHQELQQINQDSSQQGLFRPPVHRNQDRSQKHQSRGSLLLSTRKNLTLKSIT